MKLKLDENLGLREAQLFRQAGHEVATVAEQGLSGAADGALVAACTGESRCLVTLDLDFANPLLFDPRRYAGIVVLRLPPHPTLTHLHDAIRTLVAHLRTATPAKKLWIVQIGRVREYQPPDDEVE